MNEPLPPMACDLTKLSDAERHRLQAVVAELFSVAGEVRVLADGYELGYANASPETLAKMAEFIAYDRLCCAFLTHGMVSEPFGGPTWLRITGGEGAKELLAADLKRHVSAGVVVTGNL